MAREGVPASGLAKPLADDVIAAIVLAAQGFRAGYGAMLTFCERGRHGCRCFPRSCSPGAGLTPPHSTGGRHLRFHRHGRVRPSPWHRQAAARGRPRPGRGLAGMSRLGWSSEAPSLMPDSAVTGAGMSGAPCALGCEGSWVGSDGLPRASPELRGWPGASGSLGGRRLLWAAVSPHRPLWSIRIFSN